jgi:hypothetical protein
MATKPLILALIWVNTIFLCMHTYPAILYIRNLDMSIPSSASLAYGAGRCWLLLLEVLQSRTQTYEGGKALRLEQQKLEMAEVRSDLSARDLWEVENYFRKQGVSVFLYDEPIDVFRFPEDGRFAFCDTFADWERLQERGYLHF